MVDVSIRLSEGGRLKILTVLPSADTYGIFHWPSPFGPYFNVRWGATLGASSRNYDILGTHPSFHSPMLIINLCHPSTITCDIFYM